MEFAINLIQKIPAGWPRFATLAAIVAAYFFFPDFVRKLSRGQKEKEALERLTRFLQAKKLLLELETFRKRRIFPGLSFRVRRVFWPSSKNPQLRRKSQKRRSLTLAALHIA
jgi:hypothetical protein